jgi:hypothetical protein
MIDMRIKRLFFDRPKVRRAIDKAKRRVLARAGAFIRQTAKQSMRRRKGPAPQGRPPHVHEGSLRRLILFGYDRGTDSVVVGPLGFKRSKAPNLLEFGGRVTTKRPRLVRVERRGRDKRGRFTRSKFRRVEAGTRLSYRPHPFMGPALEKEQSKLPKLWANSIRG